jgi:hypothetical protein
LKDSKVLDLIEKRFWAQPLGNPKQDFLTLLDIAYILKFRANGDEPNPSKRVIRFFSEHKRE